MRDKNGPDKDLRNLFILLVSFELAGKDEILRSSGLCLLILTISVSNENQGMYGWFPKLSRASSSITAWWSNLVISGKFLLASPMLFLKISVIAGGIFIAHFSCLIRGSTNWIYITFSFIPAG